MTHTKTGIPPTPADFLVPQTGLVIKLKTQEDDERPVFISGNFNNWATQDLHFKMQKIGEGQYIFQFPQDFQYPDELAYKFTKGDWSDVEIDKYGSRTPNRYTKLKAGVQEDFVERWRHNWLPFKDSFLPKVQVLSKEVEIPQLNKKRRVWVLLPHNYQQETARYPVLYLQDAQNLFNEKSPFGNWEIDKKLAVMAEYGIGDIIIVAIEHGEKERVLEYNVGRTILGNGDGKKYIRFVTDTLKPLIDKTYRTKPDREHTGIGGSSMGGLVSFLAGIMYPEVYGKLMIFSPSLWVIPKIKFSFLDIFDPMQTRIYFYAGANESKTMLEEVRKLKKRLLKRKVLKEKLEIQVSVNPEGKHNETYWSDEFPKAIEWLFFSDRQGTDDLEGMGKETA
jgi:predicted alpha/beta superfamily hydrolase